MACARRSAAVIVTACSTVQGGSKPLSLEAEMRIGYDSLSGDLNDRNAESRWIVVRDTILWRFYVADGFGHGRLVRHRPGDGAAPRRARLHGFRDGAQA